MTRIGITINGETAYEWRSWVEALFFAWIVQTIVRAEDHIMELLMWARTPPTWGHVIIDCVWIALLFGGYLLLRRRNARREFMSAFPRVR